LHFTLADLVTDITQNASEAGANLVELEIDEGSSPDGGGREFRFLVRDNGKGMTREELVRAVDPFVTDGIKHPHRKVGLGIPFLIQTAEQSGGGCEIRSAKAGQPEAVWRTDGVSRNESPARPVPAGCAGTTTTAWFDTNNVDTPPVGDLPGMFRTILMFEGPADIRLRRSFKRADGTVREYQVRKMELAEALGNLEDTESLVLLGQYLRSLEEEGSGE
jgi:hypothetical protein